MKKNVIIALLGLAFAGALSLAPEAQAGEGLFSRAYTTETTPEGHFEIEQLVRGRYERSFGTYNAYDFKTELEYGVTDNFQASIYLNAGTMDAHGAPDDDDPKGSQPGGFTRVNSYFQGISFEFIYRVLSPIKDGFGLAFYIEPEFDFQDIHNGLRYDRTMATEYRVLFQKNFMDDQLILVYNLVFENEFIRFQGEEQWAGEFDWNNEIGLTYRFAPGFFAGLEARNHNEFGDFVNHEHSVYWAGPAFHYASQSWWGTLGVLMQVYGDPHGVDENGVDISGHNGNLFLRSHEKWEVAAKVGFPF